VVTLILACGTGVFCAQAGLRLGSRKADEGFATAGEYHDGAPARIKALGRLEPGEGVLNISAASGSRVDRLLVKEGQWVKEGQVLAYLDGHDECLANLKQAQAQLKDACDLYVAETANGKSLIREADIAVTRARICSSQEIAAHKAQLQISRDRHRQSVTDAGRSRRLARNRAIGRDELEQSRLKQDVARSELDQNQQVLKRLQQDAPLRVQEAEAKAQSARAALVRAQRAIQLPTLRAQVAAAQARWKRTILTAPVSGQVLRIFTYPGEELRNRPLLQMGETHRMYTVAEVYETSVRHVRIGQKVTVTSPALGRTLPGKVERIGQRIYKNDIHGIDPKADSDSRVVEVRIRLDDSELASRFNCLQVDVCIGG
jgi:HlyD family secretion protein